MAGHRVTKFHLGVVAAGLVGGALLGYFAAGWGAMIGSAAGGALGGAIACVLYYPDRASLFDKKSNVRDDG